jgi:hypothetical protein
VGTLEKRTMPETIVISLIVIGLLPAIALGNRRGEDKVGLRKTLAIAKFLIRKKRRRLGV